MLVRTTFSRVAVHDCGCMYFDNLLGFAMKYTYKCSVLNLLTYWPSVSSTRNHTLSVWPVDTGAYDCHHLMLRADSATITCMQNLIIPYMYGMSQSICRHYWNLQGLINLVQLSDKCRKRACRLSAPESIEILHMQVTPYVSFSDR
jgi:hypothetical protein